jgi:hypothetical protein
MAKTKTDACPQTVAGVPFETFANQIVRFEVSGEEHFGQVCTWPIEDVRQYAAKGLLLIADEIFPTSCGLSPDQVVVVKELPWDAQNPLLRHRERLLSAAQEASNKVKDFGLGKIFSIPAGDGFAWYVVTKVTAKMATVEWRGFHCDHWRDLTLDYGGVFPRSVIERHVRRCEGLRRIFGPKTGE